MRTLPIRLCLAACAVVGLSCDSRSAKPRSLPLLLQDVNGSARAPLEIGDAKALVIIFLGVECPISQSYAPEINRVCERYRPKGVGFYVVYVDSDLLAADARQRAKDFGYPCPVLLDPNHALVKRLGATVTPEAAVIGPEAALLYRGRIDDQWAALGRRRHTVTTHDLRDALDAILAANPVANPRTEAIGCKI